MDTNEQLKIPPEIKLFLEGILEEANLLTLDDEIRENMITELYLRLDAFLVGKILDNLADEKLEEFMELEKENKDPQKIQAFLDANLPNTPEIFAIAFNEFRELYLTSIDNARVENSIDDFDKTLQGLAAGIKPSPDVQV